MNRDWPEEVVVEMSGKKRRTRPQELLGNVASIREELGLDADDDPAPGQIRSADSTTYFHLAIFGKWANEQQQNGVLPDDFELTGSATSGLIALRTPFLSEEGLADWIEQKVYEGLKPTQHGLLKLGQHGKWALKAIRNTEHSSWSGIERSIEDAVAGLLRDRGFSTDDLVPKDPSSRRDWGLVAEGFPQLTFALAQRYDHLLEDAEPLREVLPNGIHRVYIDPQYRELVGTRNKGHTDLRVEERGDRNGSSGRSLAVEVKARWRLSQRIVDQIVSRYAPANGEEVRWANDESPVEDRMAILLNGRQLTEERMMLGERGWWVLERPELYESFSAVLERVSQDHPEDLLRLPYPVPDASVLHDAFTRTYTRPHEVRLPFFSATRGFLKELLYENARALANGGLREERVDYEHTPATQPLSVWADKHGVSSPDIPPGTAYWGVVRNEENMVASSLLYNSQGAPLIESFTARNPLEEERVLRASISTLADAQRTVVFSPGASNRRYGYGKRAGPFIKTRARTLRIPFDESRLVDLTEPSKNRARWRENVVGGRTDPLYEPEAIADAYRDATRGEGVESLSRMRHGAEFAAVGAAKLDS